MIHFGHPWIHVTVTVKLLLFAPKPKQRLEGVIKSVGPDHVNIVVHGVFNAFVHKDGIPQYFNFDYDNDVWEGGDGGGLKPEATVVFEVIRSRPTDGVLAMTAHLNGEGLGLVGGAAAAAPDTNESSDDAAAAPAATPSKKKKKKKSSKKIASEPEADQPKKKRKRKAEEATPKS